MAMHSEFERQFVRPRSGRTLIVGAYITKGKADRRLLYEDAIGVDMRAGPGVDMVVDMEDSPDIGRFDHVECTSVLEHSRRPWLMAEMIEQAMYPNSTLFVSVPFNWWPHAYPDDYFRMTTSAVQSLFPNIEWQQLLYVTHDKMVSDPKDLPSTMVNKHRYYARTITCGFGTRR